MDNRLKLRASGSKSALNSSACSPLASDTSVYRQGKALRGTREGMARLPLACLPALTLGSLLLELLPSFEELLCSALVSADALRDILLLCRGHDLRPASGLAAVQDRVCQGLSRLCGLLST